MYVLPYSNGQYRPLRLLRHQHSSYHWHLSANWNSRFLRWFHYKLKSKHLPLRFQGNQLLCHRWLQSHSSISRLRTEYYSHLHMFLHTNQQCHGSSTQSNYKMHGIQSLTLLHQPKCAPEMNNLKTHMSQCVRH